MDLVDSILATITDGTFAARDVESLEIEFKTDGSSRNDDLANLADAASCMANASGGTIVVGVDDKTTGPDAFLGTTLEPEKTRLRIYELTNPSLLVDAEIRTSHPRNVLAVPSSTQVHSANGKNPTERIDQHCMPMTSDRITTVTAQKTGRDWSGQRSDVPAADADPVAMQGEADDEDDREPHTPTAMAVPTPAMLPTPTREAAEIVNAWKADTDCGCPSAVRGVLSVRVRNISGMRRNCTTPDRMVK